MIKKALLLFFLFSISHSPLSAQTFNLLIGTSAGPGSGEGIYIYSFDAGTGDLSFRTKTVIDNPSYLAIAHDRKHVYSVNQVPKQMGGISALSYNETDGTLSFINKVTSGGEGPAYVSTDSKGRYVFAANYNAGTISAIPVNTDGSLSEQVQVISFTGSGPNPTRQTKPYLHCAVVSPDDRYLLANDLGTDKTYIFKIDYNNPAKPLVPDETPFMQSQPGGGPRHLTFHPNGKFVYVVYEMGGFVNVFACKNGKPAGMVETKGIFPEGFKGSSTSADIHISPDGNFLYASNRMDLNEIVIFKINKRNGKLTYTGRQSTLGKIPRNFTLDPTGNFLLAANQVSNDVFVFRRNKKTGLLTETGKKLVIASPTCLKFE